MDATSLGGGQEGAEVGRGAEENVWLEGKKELAKGGWAWKRRSSKVVAYIFNRSLNL